MSAIAYGNWITDLATSTCWNCVNRVIVAIENDGNTLTGKIKDIPVDLLDKWALDPQCNKYLSSIVSEAKEAFTKAYYENDFEHD